MTYHKKESVAKAKHKTERSPFLVDLVAENERIEEESRVRKCEEVRRTKQLQTRKEKVKAQIIYQAVTEPNDVEALRKEKKMIAEEEKRLKALKDLQKAERPKANLNAQLREEQRRNRAAQRELVQQRKDLQKAAFERHAEALKAKCGYKKPDAFSYVC